MKTQLLHLLVSLSWELVAFSTWKLNLWAFLIASRISGTLLTMFTIL